MDVRPFLSLRTIDRILSRNDLTHRRTGRYEPKGVACPNFPASVPNERHKGDFVGLRQLRGAQGAIRFYDMNTVALATGPCETYPVFSRTGNALYEAFWDFWGRLGIPQHLRIDNELVFYGSPTHPRGMSPLIRLCLHYGIELRFIPPSKPWRNGVIEQFNHHYQQKILDRVSMQASEELLAQLISNPLALLTPTFPRKCWWSCYSIPCNA